MHILKSQRHNERRARFHDALTVESNPARVDKASHACYLSFNEQSDFGQQNLLFLFYIEPLHEMRLSAHTLAVGSGSEAQASAGCNILLQRRKAEANTHGSFR